LSQLLLSDNLTLVDQANDQDNAHTALMYAVMSGDHYQLANCLIEEFHASVDKPKTLVS
jgi:hypothetical protein